MCGGKGNCTFDKKSVAGGSLDIAGTCKDAGGKTAKIAATGTLGASAQDINMTVEGFDAAGAKVQMADFGVAHLSRGQADIEAARAQCPARIIAIERVVKGPEGALAGGGYRKPYKARYTSAFRCTMRT